MRLLIVDDDSIVRRLLYAALTAAGHEIEQAKDGTAAWEVLQREPIRLVITDWMMPLMDGGELIRRIRAVPDVPHTYIILLTAKGEKDDIVSGLEGGADDYLTKPFHPEELRARVRNGERIVELEARLQHQLAVTKAITTGVGEGIFTLDREGRFTYLNPAAEQMLGWTAAEVTGLNMHDTIHYQRADRTPPASADCPLLAVNRTGVLVRVEEAFTRRDGAVFLVECTAAPVLLHNRISGIVVTFHDITDRKHVERHLADLAHYDHLTGLANRTLFIARLDGAIIWAAREERTLALLFLDLDGFKAVNDTHGHGIGDLLLHVVGERLSRCVREGDTVARLAGDEFTVLLPNIGSATHAAAVAGKIIAALSQPYTLADQVISVFASVGYALYPDDADEPSRLLALADAAMYAVKRKGNPEKQRLRNIQGGEMSPGAGRTEGTRSQGVTNLVLLSAHQAEEEVI